MDAVAAVTPSKLSILIARSNVFPPIGSCFARRFPSKLCTCISISRQGHRRRGLVVRAASSSGSSTNKIAPLRLESSDWAVSFLDFEYQQLELLQTDRDADQQKQDPSASSGTDLVLYRRIAELWWSEETCSGAVTFGSFLWDVESYVESRYHFGLN
ncbi:hypothetical protein RIF29_04445 [Crotalaria pallida]|uniref:Uncharacterized protein n=1 Tax=Crotalaria pallida TaxID=3830 RepID=A0AAN9J3H8_CROPI